jgi:tRNA U38,U39,U40 pseudouridine synthase TruA
VTRIDVVRRGALLVIDVVGESFLWNQVRRMVAAARRVAEGEVAPDAVARALAGGPRVDLGTAPPEPLLLLDVAYGDEARFVAAPEADRARLFERLRRRIEAREVEDAVLRDVLRGALG